MTTLHDMITDAMLAQSLIRLRMNVATKRHDAHFFNNIVTSKPYPSAWTGQLDEVMPPRSRWHRPMRHQRGHKTREEIARGALLVPLMWGIKNGKNEAWAQKLQILIGQVRERALSPTLIPIKVPVVKAIPKPQLQKKAEGTYRALASYEELSDRLLLGITAKYLVRKIDPLLQDCACAFRGHGQMTRDTAVRKIVQFLKAKGGGKVYAAECDIKGFYDSINHDVLRQAFAKASQQLSEQGVPLDPVVEVILEQCLAGYDYFGYGLPEARNVLAKTGNSGREISGPDYEELLKLTPAGRVPRFGIPQGGPLSPLLANLVMDAADRAVLGDGTDPDLLYLRFCDDMIILHTDKDKCQQALKRYLDAVAELGFVVHQPKRIMRYGAEFHKEKSKLPYRVADPGVRQNASPWINFLGYQIRYDGGLRVKKDSLERHKKNQTTLVSRIQKLIARPRAQLKLKNCEIIASVAGRMVAVGVGKPARAGAAVTELARCWLAAFPLLADSPLACGQMRLLDRHRDRLVSKLFRALTVSHPSNEHHRCLIGKPRIGREKSYCGQVSGTPRSHVPWKAFKDHGYGRNY
jgi:hypothetical protein